MSQILGFPVYRVPLVRRLFLLSRHSVKEISLRLYSEDSDKKGKDSVVPHKSSTQTFDLNNPSQNDSNKSQDDSLKKWTRKFVKNDDKFLFKDTVHTEQQNAEEGNDVEQTPSVKETKEPPTENYPQGTTPEIKATGGGGKSDEIKAEGRGSNKRKSSNDKCYDFPCRDEHDQELWNSSDIQLPTQKIKKIERRSEWTMAQNTVPPTEQFKVKIEGPKVFPPSKPLKGPQITILTDEESPEDTSKQQNQSKPGPNQSVESPSTTANSKTAAPEGASNNQQPAAKPQDSQDTANKAKENSAQSFPKEPIKSGDAKENPQKPAKAFQAQPTRVADPQQPAQPKIEKQPSRGVDAAQTKTVKDPNESFKAHTTKAADPKKPTQPFQAQPTRNPVAPHEPKHLESKTAKKSDPKKQEPSQALKAQTLIKNVDPKQAVPPSPVQKPQKSTLQQPTQFIAKQKPTEESQKPKVAFHKPEPSKQNSKNTPQNTKPKPANDLKPKALHTSDFKAAALKSNAQTKEPIKNFRDLFRKKPVTEKNRADLVKPKALNDQKKQSGKTLHPLNTKSSSNKGLPLKPSEAPKIKSKKPLENEIGNLSKLEKPKISKPFDKADFAEGNAVEDKSLKNSQIGESKAEQNISESESQIPKFIGRSPIEPKRIQSTNDDSLQSGLEKSHEINTQEINYEAERNAAANKKNRAKEPEIASGSNNKKINNKLPVQPVLTEPLTVQSETQTRQSPSVSASPTEKSSHSDHISTEQTPASQQAPLQVTDTNKTGLKTQNVSDAQKASESPAPQKTSENSQISQAMETPAATSDGKSRTFNKDNIKETQILESEQAQPTPLNKENPEKPPSMKAEKGDKFNEGKRFVDQGHINLSNSYVQEVVPTPTAPEHGSNRFEFFNFFKSRDSNKAQGTNLTVKKFNKNQDASVVDGCNQKDGKAGKKD